MEVSDPHRLQEKGNEYTAFINQDARDVVLNFIRVDPHRRVGYESVTGDKAPVDSPQVWLLIYRYHVTLIVPDNDHVELGRSIDPDVETENDALFTLLAAALLLASVAWFMTGSRRRNDDEEFHSRV